MSKKILILFAHPALQKSRVNKYLVEDIKNINDVTFRDLYQTYPDFHIDVKQEQQLLEEHDVLIFQHPFFWYSTPAILKEWQDLVLEHGWAYGSKGNALKDKLFFNVMTAGGGAEAYCEQGYNYFTVKQLLAPIEQTANLCKMIFLPPYVVHGTHSIKNEDISEHKKTYKKLLAMLSNDQVNVEKAKKLKYLNEYLKQE